MVEQQHIVVIYLKLFFGDMSNLLKISRPTLALIKLVEAIGILLEIPFGYTKSSYKATLPSNYDETVEKLSSNYEEIFAYLISLKSCDISNKMARELYSKMEEPGFNYDDVVSQAGLELRELFNSVVFNLLQLQNDRYRIPLQNTNIFVAVNGSRSSYVALDVAAHVHSHGVLHVGAITAEDSVLRGQNDMMLHLPIDLERRCKRQYEKTNYLYKVCDLSCSNTAEIVPSVSLLVEREHCDIVVVGLETNGSVDSGLEQLASWAATQCDGKTVILAKSCVRVLTFGESFISRKFQVCVKHLDELELVFRSCLALMRPNDTIVLLTILETKGTLPRDLEKKNNRPNDTPNCSSRYDFGRRPGLWVSEAYHVSSRALNNQINAERELEVKPMFDEPQSGEDPFTHRPASPKSPNCLLLNETSKATSSLLNSFEIEMNRLIADSQIEGKVRIEQYPLVPKTSGRIIGEIATEEAADFIVLRRGKNARNLSTECVKDSMCSVVLID